MSENILSPIVDSLFDYGKFIINNLKGSNVDFDKLFKNIGFHNKDNVKPKMVKFTDEEYFRVYEFKIPYGMCIDDFKKKLSYFSQILNVNEKDIIFKKNNYNVVIKARKNKKLLCDYDCDVHKCIGFKVPIGIEIETMKVRYFDFSDQSNANMYIAGSSRCGKSTLIRLMLTILSNKSASDVQFSLLNIKNVDLNEFKDVKNTIHYTVDEDESIDILDDNIVEMKKRYSMFAKYNCKNIWQYRKQINKMPLRIIVIEEIGAYEDNKDFHDNLKLLSQQGAGAGIFLMIATQLPSYKNLPNTTKQNINTTIGGKCKDSIRSDIVIDDGDLYKLKGNGHMKIFDSYEHGTEIQVFWIDDAKVLEVCNKNIKRKKDK